MQHFLARLVAGTVLALALLVAPALATPVTVRIEGDTVAGAIPVNTTGSGVPGLASCGPNSAGEALEKATLGNWDRSAFVSTILGEDHSYAASDYWAFWVNGSYSQVGICAYTVQPGDELLFYKQVDGPGFVGTIYPLYFSSAPTAVAAGAPYTVSVIERLSDGTTTTSGPAVGATVSDGSSSAVTDSNGQATLTAPLSGPIQLVASQGSRVNSPRPNVAVVAVLPSTSAPVDTPPATTTTPATTAPTPDAPSQADTKAPIATIASLTNRQRFAKGKGPRELKGSVSDTGALKSVEVRLRRQSGKACFSFDGTAERFAKTSCAKQAAWFSVGSTADWSYLLPSKLASGLYQLQVRATDAAGNQSSVQSLRFRVA